MKRYILALMVVLFVAAPAYAKGHSIIKLAEDIVITQDMDIDEAVSIGGNVIVYGRVENNVVAVGGNVTLKSGSYVGNEAVVVGGELYRDQGSVVRGRITQVYVPRFIPSVSAMLKGGWVALWATISIMVLLGFLGLAILMVAIIPEHLGTAVNAIERSFAWMLFWGLFWAVLIIPIAALLAISIIGIILIPLEILLVALAMLLGYIVSAIFIGKSLFLSFKRSPPPFVDAILGMFVFFLAGMVPIAGSIVNTLFLIAGFGAVVTTRFGTLKK